MSNDAIWAGEQEGQKVEKGKSRKYLCKNDWWGATPFTWNFESNWPTALEQNRQFSIYFCS